MHHLVAVLVGLVVLLLAALPRADDDHHRAREALRRGDIQPLAAALDAVEARYPGEVLEVELEDEDDDPRHPYVYEIKLLTRDGRVMKLELDAATLEVLEVRGGRGRRGEDDD